MTRKRALLAVLLALVAIPLIGEIIVPPRGGGGTGGNNNTNGYSFNGPFTTVNGTNVYLHAAISNIVMTGVITNLADSQFANETTVAVIKDGVVVTNLSGYFTHHVYGHEFVSTNLTVTNTLTVINGGVVAGGGVIIPNGAALTLQTGSDLIGLDSSTHSLGSSFDPFIISGYTNHILELSTNTSYFKSNLVVQGRLDGMNIRLIGGQNASSLAIVDGNTNIIGWISTNVIGNLSGATNGLATDVATLQAGTNGLNTGVNGLIARAVTNADTRTTWINNLNIGNNLRVTNTLTVDGLSGFAQTIFANGGLTAVNGLQGDTLLATTSSTLQGGGSFAGIFTVFDGFDPSSTNIIHSLTTDASPANGDFIMTEDISTGLLKKVSIGNLPTGSGEVNVIGDAGVTNSTKTSLSHSKAGVTNFLKTVEAGYGLVRTNQGTNLNFAIDTSVVSVLPGGAFPQLLYKDTGGVVSGTTNLTWNSSNNFLRLENSGSVSAPSLVMSNRSTGDMLALGPSFLAATNNSLKLYAGTYGALLSVTDGSFKPSTGSDAQDIGSSANRWRTNWADTADLSSVLALRDSSTVNSGRGTLFAHPADWKVTNLFVFSVTNPAAGQVLRVNSASISGGLATIVVTNDTLSTDFGSGMFLRGTNMWFDGGTSSLYSNVFTSTSGGLTNILATNIVDGQSVHLWFWASNGVTVNFPQFVDSDYPDGSVISANSNCWTHVIIDRRNTVTNISMFTAGLTLKAGNFTEAITNYATRAITYQNNTRTTNYATGALTIDCSTDVRANITNAVASNFAITLATPVLFTAGSLSLVSDSSARTLAILCPSSTITWMSTNYTANSTNILTAIAKRSIFSWRHQLASDGVTTNTACWVINQTP